MGELTAKEVEVLRSPAGWSCELLCTQPFRFSFSSSKSTEVLDVPGDKRMKAGASLSQHRVDSGPERVHVNFLWAKPLEEK